MISNMKTIQILLAAASTMIAVASQAQQDFSGPQYAKWGDTPEAREKNIINSNFLKESCCLLYTSDAADEEVWG